MKPLVSVICLTYNHEKYIRDALEGFVSQKTNFPYEVYIHDDASNDSTAHIIREYADKYPDIIIPIFQTENQYSKDVPITKTFVFPLIKGKYIAFCEGDDFWCDKYKLQRQVDWLEEHPEYSFCVHNTRLLDMETGEERLYNPNKEDCDISLEDILQVDRTEIHTSSYMFRAEFKEIPEEFRIYRVGDYPRAVYLALCGKVRYLHNVMSVYRRNVEGSWSKHAIAAPFSEREKRVNQVIQMLRNVDLYTDGKYKEFIDGQIRKSEFLLLLRKGDLKTVKNHYAELYDELDNQSKLILGLKYLFPDLYRIYKRIKTR